jgi:hypothetical protein
MNPLSYIKCSDRFVNNFDPNNNQYICNNFNNNSKNKFDSKNNFIFYNNYNYSIPNNIKPYKTLLYNQNFKTDCSNDPNCSFISISKNKNSCIGFNNKNKKVFEKKNYDYTKIDCDNECLNNISCTKSKFIKPKEAISFYNKINSQNSFPIKINSNNYKIIKLMNLVNTAFINNFSSQIKIPNVLLYTFFILYPQKLDLIDITFNDDCWLYLATTNPDISIEFKKMNEKIKYNDNELNLYEKKFNKDDKFILNLNKNFEYFVFISNYDITQKQIQILQKDIMDQNNLKYSDSSHNCKFSLEKNMCLNNNMQIKENFENQEEENDDTEYYQHISNLDTYGKKTLGSSFLNGIFSYIDNLLLFKPKNMIKEQFNNTHSLKTSNEKFLLLFLIFSILILIIYKKILKLIR